jgi:hypothetical protein
VRAAGLEFYGREFRHPVRERCAALVEHDNTTEASQPIEPPGEFGVRPVVLDVRDESRDENEIYRTGAELLVCHMHAAVLAYRVLGINRSPSWGKCDTWPYGATLGAGRVGHLVTADNAGGFSERTYTPGSTVSSGCTPTRGSRRSASVTFTFMPRDLWVVRR